MITQNIFYGWPQAAYLLLIIPILVWLFVALFLYRRRQLSQFASPKMLKQILLPRSDFIFWGKCLAVCLTWIFAVIALMQPKSYGEYPIELRTERGKDSQVPLGGERQPHEVLLLIDVSKSMEVADAQNGRQRLDVAKEIADQIIERLEGQNIALDVFTGQELPLVPPTTDYLFTRLLLRNLQINEGGTSGTDFVSALKSMRERYFFQPGLPFKTLIVLSDGGDTRLETLQGNASAQRMQEIVNTVKNAEQDQLKVFTIGIGTLQGGQVPEVQFEGQPVQSKLNDVLLKALSSEGKGKYYAAQDYSTIDLANLITTQINKIGLIKEGASGSKEDNLIHKLYYQIPLALAMLLLSGILFIPDTYKSSVTAVILILVNVFAEADDVQLMRKAEAFDAIQEHVQARGLYQDKLQDDSLPSWQRAILLYDIGYSYLKENQWNQAVQTLTTVPLSDNPSPLLRYRLKRNLALAFLGQAKTLTGNADQAFDNAEKSVQEAEQAYCDLERAMGKQICSENQSLQLLKEEIKRQRALKRQSKPKEETKSQDIAKQQPASTASASQTDHKELPAESLRVLLEMSQEDKIQLPQLPAQQKELRPW